MCGILFTRGFSLQDNNRALERIFHRGPDYQSFEYFDRDFFGHTRLSILDLNDRSNQPFKDENGNLLIFNGEIYNYHDIKAILQKDFQITFNTTGDTEVLFWILKLKQYHLLDLMNGMWAFVFKNSENQIFYSRDRFGIKPLFLFNNGGELVLASELTSIKTLKRLQIDDKIVVNFLIRPSSVNGRNSFFEKVDDVEGGVLFSLNEKNKIESIRKFSDSPPLRNEIKVTVEDAVRIRRNCDVEVGLTLSSGLDSNVIANVLYHSPNNESMKTFTVSSKNIDTFESDVAMDVSNRYKFEHHKITLDSESFLSELEETIKFLGRPHSSYAITSAKLMYRYISYSGIKVLLEGQGADERFGGYRILEYPAKFWSLFRNLKLISAFKIFMESKVPIRYYFKYILDRTTKFFGIIYFLKMNNILKLDLELLKSIKKANKGLEENLQNLLFYSDHLSMRYGIEVRNPFMDFRFRKVQNKFDNKFTKLILRENFKEIDDEVNKNIVWNTSKLGFYTPMLEILKKNKQNVNKLYRSFSRRGIIKLKKNFNVENISSEEETRLVYRIISTEIWLKNL